MYLTLFKILKDLYWKDKNNVYYDWGKIEWADSKTFEVLDESHSKDKNNVYYFWEKIKLADSKTFKKVDWVFKDKNWEYINWKFKK